MVYRRRTRGARARELHSELSAALHVGKQDVEAVVHDVDPNVIRGALLLHSKSPPVGGTLMHAAAGSSAGHRALLSLMTIASGVIKATSADSRWFSQLLNARDLESGWTPLHVAMYKGLIRNAVVLLRMGASPYVRDWDGEFPADLLRLRALTFTVTKPLHGNDCTCKLPWVNEVFGWGSNVSMQIGVTGTGVDLSPRRLPIGGGGASDNNFVMINALPHRDGVSTSERHSLFVSTRGEVRVVGYGKHGVLGLGKQTKTAIHPKIIRGGKLHKYRVVAVATSTKRSAAISSCGALFLWGNDDLYVPERVLGGNLEMSSVAQIALSDKFWIVVDTYGMVWGCGSNKHGALALDETVETLHLPRQLPVVCSRGRVLRVFVSRGLSDSRNLIVAALLCNGEVFLWGGSLGHTPRRVVISDDLPVRRISAPFVADVAVGDGFIICLTSVGRTYVCSSLQHSKTLIAKALLVIPKRSVVSVSAFGRRTVLIDEVGDAWELDVVPSAENGVDVSSCNRVDGLRGVQCVDIGKNHAVCVVSPGFSHGQENTHLSGHNVPNSVSRADYSVHLSLQHRLSQDPVEIQNDYSNSAQGCARFVNGTCQGVSVVQQHGQSENGRCSDQIVILDAPVGDKREIGSYGLERLCGDLMFKTCTVSSALEMLRFAVDHYAFGLRDQCLSYLRFNIDRCLMTRSGLESLQSFDEDNINALEVLLRGQEAVAFDEESVRGNEQYPFQKTLQMCDNIRYHSHMRDQNLNNLSSEHRRKKERNLEKAFQKSENLEKLNSRHDCSSRGVAKRPTVTNEFELLSKPFAGNFSDEALISSNPPTKRMTVDTPNDNSTANCTPAGDANSCRFSTDIVLMRTHLQENFHETKSGQRMLRETPSNTFRHPSPSVFTSEQLSRSEFNIADVPRTRPVEELRAAASRPSSASLCFTPIPTNQASMESEQTSGEECSPALFTSSSRVSRKKTRRRAKPVFTMGAMKSTVPADTSGDTGSDLRSQQSPRTNFRPVSLSQGSSAKNSEVLPVRSVWGRQEAKILNLREALDAHADIKNHRQSLTDIQAEQEESSRLHEHCETLLEYGPNSLSLERYGPGSTNFSERAEAVQGKIERDTVHAAAGAGGITIGAFLIPARPIAVSYSREHNKGGNTESRPDLASDRVVWGTSSGSTGNVGSAGSPSSFRDIQIEEEKMKRSSTALSGFGSPREIAWMMLPGDQRAPGKSLRYIEVEERAMKEIKETAGGGIVRLARERT